MRALLSSPRRLAGALVLPTLAAAATLAAAPAAHAASINCDASAIRLSVLGQPLEPVTANRGAATCTAAKGPANISLAGLGVPLTAGVLSAQTLSAGEGSAQKALAVGGLVNLDLAALPQLALPDLSTLIPASLKTISVDLSPITGAANLILTPLGLTLPTRIDVGLEAALKDLITPLPNLSLLHVGTVNAFAGASCVNGTATPVGIPQVADITVLGQSVNADGVLRDIPVLDTQNLDLSKLDITKLVLPKVITDLGLSALTTPVLTLVNNLLKTTLAALPPIQIPAQVAQVRLENGRKSVEGGVLTQHGLDVSIALLGQQILSGTLGEARVSTSGVDCSSVTNPASTTEAALACTTRDLVLTDVYESGGRVKLLGAADKKLAGRTVTIRFEADGTTAAQTAIRPDGSFSATAALPPKKVRASNKARYVAIVGKEKSLNLKLQRRMYVTGMSVADGKVTISGRVTRPLGKPVQPIKVQRRVSCSRNQTVRTFLPKADGTFRVTVAAPAGQSAAVYRLATKVRKTTSNSKLFDTFTLPRAVDLA